MWEESYPDTESWALAYDALALDSTDGYCKQHELLEQALANAGNPTVLFDRPESREQVAITPVEWRTSPYLATHSYGGHTCDVLLFDTRATAQEWADLRIKEIQARDSEQA